MYRITNKKDGFLFEFARKGEKGVISKIYFDNKKIETELSTQQAELLEFFFEKGGRVSAEDFCETYEIEAVNPGKVFSDIKYKIKKKELSKYDESKAICLADLIKKDKGYYNILSGYSIENDERKNGKIDLPKLPEDYYDRSEYHEKIRRALNLKKIAILLGEDGVGKTTLAISYAKNNLENYYVIMLDAKSLDALSNSIERYNKFFFSNEKNEINADSLVYNIKRINYKLYNKSSKKPNLFIITCYCDDIYNENSFKVIVEVINKLALGKENYIILTTKRDDVESSIQVETEKINVEGFSCREAVDYLKLNNDFPYPDEFTEDSPCPDEFIEEDFPDSASFTKKLFDFFWVRKIDSKEKRISIQDLTLIKNQAIINGGFDKIDFSTIYQDRFTTSSFIVEMFKKIAKEYNNGKLFIEILKIISFINEEKIEKGFLVELIKYCLPVTEEEIDYCVNFFDSKIKLKLLNYVDQSKENLSINKLHKKAIFEFIQCERAVYQQKILDFFMTIIYPFSYYGANTMKTNEAMNHLKAFYSLTKGFNNHNNKEYYSLIRAMLWYYGYVKGDKYSYEQIYNEIDKMTFPLIEKYLIKADDFIIRIKYSGLDEERYRNEEIVEAYDKVLNEFKKIQEMSVIESGFESKALLVRWLIAVASYEMEYANGKKSKITIGKGIDLCNQLSHSELTNEQRVFVTESKSRFLQIKARVERSEKSEKSEKSDEHYKKSLDCARKSIKIFGHEYEYSIESLINDRNYKGMKNAASYMEAFSYNLMAVVYTEKMQSLEDLYEAEKNNSASLDKYKILNNSDSECSYDMYNQTVNFVNIYRAQGGFIIGRINKYIDKNYDPKNDIQRWKEYYNKMDIVPGLLDEKNKEKSVKEWMDDYHSTIKCAFEYYDKSKKICNEMYNKNSWSYYTYLIPLMGVIRMENSFSVSEKYDILMEKLEGTPYGIREVFSEFKKALSNTFSLKFRSKLLAYRYYGVSRRYFIEFSKDKEEREKLKLNAEQAFSEGLDLAEKIGDTNEKDKINKEQNNLDRTFNRKIN